MGMIPQVTCRNCRKKFSKLKKHCPYCGMERVRQSTRAAASTASTVKETSANQRAKNMAKYRMIFGGIILVAVIACTIAMVSISIQNADSAAKDDKQDSGQASTALSDNKKDEVDTDQKDDADQQDNDNDPDPDADDQQSGASSVTSIAITYLSTEKTEFSMAIGDKIQLDASVYPQSEADRSVTWSTSNTSVISVSDDGLVTGIGSGEAYVIATCEGVQKQCKVYVW